MKTRIVFFFLWINLVSCYKNHFYVQQEWIDRDFLASSYVGTPDPRQGHPPLGQRLLVSWNFPRSIFDQHLSLSVTVRFWDDTQRTIVEPIERKRDFSVFYFPHDVPGTDKRILTYRVQAIALNGKVVGHWDHQFWTELIEIGPKDNFSSAHRSSSSVSSQERQGSVIETP